MARTRWATDVPESDVFGRFFKVPRVVQDKNLLKFASRPARLVFYALLGFRWRSTSEAFVGVEKLARTTGLHPATVMKATKELEEQGLIRKLGRTDQRVLRYELLPYGEEVPPQMTEMVRKRAGQLGRRACTKVRNSQGRFRSQPVGVAQDPALSVAEEPITALACPSSGHGYLNSSGDGVQNSTDTGHHIDVPLDVPEK
jgi:DNA-binding MarR family transcriptional regulator